MPRVLDERAVEVEAVSRRDVGEDGAEQIDRQLDLLRIFDQDAILHLSARLAPVETVLTIMMAGFESKRSMAAM